MTFDKTRGDFIQLGVRKNFKDRTEEDMGTRQKETTE